MNHEFKKQWYSINTFAYNKLGKWRSEVDGKKTFKNAFFYWGILTCYSQSGNMCMVLIAVTVRVVMVLVLFTVRKVRFVSCLYLLQPGWICLCGFNAVTGRIFKSVRCLYCYSQDIYICIVFFTCCSHSNFVCMVFYKRDGHVIELQQDGKYCLLFMNWSCIYIYIYIIHVSQIHYLSRVELNMKLVNIHNTIQNSIVKYNLVIVQHLCTVYCMSITNYCKLLCLNVFKCT